MGLVTKKSPTDGGMEGKKIEKIIGSTGLSVSISGGEGKTKKAQKFSFLVMRTVR